LIGLDPKRSHVKQRRVKIIAACATFLLMQLSSAALSAGVIYIPWLTFSLRLDLLLNNYFDFRAAKRANCQPV
jgi:hypothetical protein